MWISTVDVGQSRKSTVDVGQSRKSTVDVGQSSFHNWYTTTYFVY